jgi:Tfp pilus assembly protein PilX
LFIIDHTVFNMKLKNESGFSLLIALIILMSLTIVGLAIMRSGVLSEKQAANIQEKSVSFHGAQSSNNGVIESYRYNPNLLAETLDAPAQTIATCIDSAGNVSRDCDTLPTIDNASGVLKGITQTRYKQCLTALKCTGNSAGMSNPNPIGCNVFQHIGTGWVDIDGDGAEDADEAKTQIEQWSFLLAACS